MWFGLANLNDDVGAESSGFKTTLGIKFPQPVERVGREYVSHRIVEKATLGRREGNGLVGDGLPMSEAVDVCQYSSRAGDSGAVFASVTSRSKKRDRISFALG